MRLYESSGLTHLQQADRAVDKLLLESTGSSMTREIKTVHVLRARDLHSYICSVFAILKKRTTYFHEHPEREVNILIGGDKGGSYTKFHFEIVALGIVSYNVHIFAMFEALDSLKNMLKRTGPSLQQSLGNAGSMWGKSELFWKIILASYMGHSFELFLRFFCLFS